MGRLYWKFFIFLFLAQMTAVIGVGVAFSIERERDDMRREQAMQLQAPDQRALPMPPPRPPRHKHGLPLIPISVGTLASFIFAALLAWYFSRPIKQLRQAFDSAANGNLSVRVGAQMGRRRDELVDLGNAFDVMASRLGTLMQSQTRLLHQVSHELRSPLARLQIAVGLARQQPEKIESSLTRIERESVRMDELVGQLLTLSRLESGVTQLEKEPVDLNELLGTIIEDAQFEGEAKHMHIEFLPQHAAKNAVFTILGQQDLLHRAIDNVVRNALKFSPNQSKVSILTSVENGMVKITVNDTGTGVPEDELAQIYEPFYRGSQSLKTDGYGVGLSITKQIIEAHGGRILAQNLPTGGLSVSIRLPVAQA
jgi:signal transduction histidine kinase